MAKNPIPSFVDVLPMRPQHFDVELGPDRSRTQCLTLWSLLLQPQCHAVCARRCDVDLRDGDMARMEPRP